MPEDEAGPELNQAGAVVDQAIGYLVREGVPDVAIASALLGGAVRMLLRSMPPAQVASVLRKAVASVEAGEVGG